MSAIPAAVSVLECLGGIDSRGHPLHRIAREMKRADEKLAEVRAAASRNVPKGPRWSSDHSAANDALRHSEARLWSMWKFYGLREAALFGWCDHYGYPISPF